MRRLIVLLVLLSVAVAALLKLKVQLLCFDERGIGLPFDAHLKLFELDYIKDDLVGEKGISVAGKQTIETSPHIYIEEDLGSDGWFDDGKYELMASVLHNCERDIQMLHFPDHRYSRSDFKPIKCGVKNETCALDLVLCLSKSCPEKIKEEEEDSFDME